MSCAKLCSARPAPSLVCGYPQVDMERGNPPPPCTSFRLAHDMVPELLMIWEMVMVRASAAPMCVRVRLCLHMCVCMPVRMCVCACACVYVRARACACARFSCCHCVCAHALDSPAVTVCACQILLLSLCACAPDSPAVTGPVQTLLRFVHLVPCVACNPLCVCSPTADAHLI